MFENTRQAAGEDMNDHVPTQEQATTTNNNYVGKAGNAFINIFYTMMT